MIECATFAVCENLKSVEFPEGLESIGLQAFRGCGVESITAPKSLKTIYNGAFLKCQNLRQVVLNDSMKTLGINRNAGELGNYGGVFQDCKNLKQIELPSELESIGVLCFCDSGLESFVAPRALRTIHQGAFYECEHLKEVQLNEDLEILGTDEHMADGGMWCGIFEDSGLGRIRLPSTLKRIEYKAFKNCKNLKNVQLPEKLEYVGNSCFYGSGLESIAFPPSIRVIGPYAFCECR